MTSIWRWCDRFLFLDQNKILFKFFFLPSLKIVAIFSYLQKLDLLIHLLEIIFAKDDYINETKDHCFIQLTENMNAI